MSDPSRTRIARLAAKRPARAPAATSLRRRQPKPGLARLVMERDGFRCRKCEYHAPDGAGLELHHVVPYDRGGLTVAWNLHVLCASCHAELSWVWCDRPLVPYEQWLRIIPATMLCRLMMTLSGDIQPPDGGSIEMLELLTGIAREDATAVVRGWPRAGDLERLKGGSG